MGTRCRRQATLIGPIAQKFTWTRKVSAGWQCHIARAMLSRIPCDNERVRIRTAKA